MKIENESDKCIESFTQYSLITKSNKIYQLDVNEGVHSFEKVYYGHSESSWKTEYITNTNFKNSLCSPQLLEFLDTTGCLLK